MWDLKDVLAAAERGDVEAQIKLGDYYCQFGFEREGFAQGKERYLIAAQQGNITGQIKLGDLCFRYLEQFAEAEQWYRTAASQGDAEAQVRLGDYYRIHEHELTKAAEWYEQAANRGHGEAQVRLGDYYYFDMQNFDRAESWYLKAVGQGNERAHYLADCKTHHWYQQWYRYRDNNIVGLNRILENILNAAEKEGNVFAQGILGDYFRLFSQDSDDSVKAESWHLKAANLSYDFVLQYNAQLKAHRRGFAKDEAESATTPILNMQIGLQTWLAEYYCTYFYDLKSARHYPLNLDKAEQYYLMVASNFAKAESVNCSLKTGDYAARTNPTNLAAAQIRIGDFYCFHKLDYIEAEKWYFKALEWYHNNGSEAEKHDLSIIKSMILRSYIHAHKLDKAKAYFQNEQNHDSQENNWFSYCEYWVGIAMLAEQGYAEAQVKLAEYFCSKVSKSHYTFTHHSNEDRWSLGYWTPVIAKAEVEYRKAADQGHIGALRWLGDYFGYSGITGLPTVLGYGDSYNRRKHISDRLVKAYDLAKAEEFYLRSDSRDKLGELYFYDLHNPAKAATCYQITSESCQDSLATQWIGDFYYFYLHDYKKAEEWYREAIKFEQLRIDNQKDMENSFNNYLEIIQLGLDNLLSGVLQAAEQGDIEAQVKLGKYFYELFSHVDKSGRSYMLDQSEAWYRKAADQGHGEAMIWLGEYYSYSCFQSRFANSHGYHHLGMINIRIVYSTYFYKPDYTKSLIYFTKASTQERVVISAKANFWPGVIHQYVFQKFSEAEYYYLIAIGKGENYAILLQKEIEYARENIKIVRNRIAYLKNAVSENIEADAKSSNSEFNNSVSDRTESSIIGYLLGCLKRMTRKSSTSFVSNNAKIATLNDTNDLNRDGPNE